MKHLIAYITAPNRKEAESISKSIIADRLAACTNILDNMSALFHWDNEVQSENEVVLIAKTTAEAYPALEDRVREQHSYDCPCIIALPVVAGNAEYLEWIEKEVKKP